MFRISEKSFAHIPHDAAGPAKTLVQSGLREG